MTVNLRRRNRGSMVCFPAVGPSCTSPSGILAIHYAYETISLITAIFN